MLDEEGGGAQVCLLLDLKRQGLEGRIILEGPKRKEKSLPVRVHTITPWELCSFCSAPTEQLRGLCA